MQAMARMGGLVVGREASVVLRSVRQLNSSAACMGRKTASRVGIVAQIYLFAIDLSDACLAELLQCFLDQVPDDLRKTAAETATEAQRSDRLGE